MTAPVVSIVVPVYNSEKTISKCLDSLISQTFENIEIICVNDCSKDNSLQVLNEYASKDRRIVIINHKENMNAGGARNSGIRAAKGKYICFVDNDDWMTSNAIETLIAESENLSVDLVVCQWCQYYNENRKTNMRNLVIGGDDKDNKEYALLHGCRILGCLFKKDLFYKNDLFFPERSFWEDNAIGISLIFSAERIKVIDKVLYYYQMVQESSSRSITMHKIKDRIKTSDLAVANLERLGFVNNENKPLVDYLYLCFSYHTIKQLELIGNSEAKCQLRIVADKIRPLLPNSYLTEYRKEYVNTLTHPKIYFYIDSFFFFLKKILYKYYKKIKVKYVLIKKLIYTIALLISMVSCEKNEDVEGIYIENIPVKCIYHNSKEYAAFCDLIYYNGNFLTCFRVGPNHVPNSHKENGYIKILKSADGISWSLVTDVIDDKYDLRDPCFCINNLGNLILYYGFYSSEDNLSIPFRTGYTEFKNVNKNIVEVGHGNVDLGDKSTLWAWKIYKHQSRFYTVAYYERNIFPTLLVSDNAMKFDVISEIPVDGNETSLVFENNRIYAFIRNFQYDGNCFVCFSDYPYVKWSIVEQDFALASPESFIVENDIFVAGRSAYGMSLFKLNKINYQLEPVYNYFALGSYSDCGYPGIVVDYKKSYMWTVFYGCDNSSLIPSIYLTKLHFTSFLNDLYNL